MMKPVQVYDKRAYKDILTYGPPELVIKMLLPLSLDDLSRACRTSKRILNICNTETFVSTYFKEHKEQIYKIFRNKLPILDEDVIDDEISDINDKDKVFLKKWLPMTTWDEEKKVGWSVDAEDNNAILLSVMKNRPEAVKFLLENGADPSFVDSPALLITIAAEEGFIKIMNILFNDGRVQPDLYHEALKRAYQAGKKDSVSLLKKWYKKNGKEIPNLANFERRFM